MQHAPWLALNAAIAVLCLRVHPTLFVLVVAATAMVCATHTPPGSGVTSSASSAVSARAATTEGATTEGATTEGATTEGATAEGAEAEGAEAEGAEAEGAEAEGAETAEGAADRVPNPRKTASEPSGGVRARPPTEFGYADETPAIHKAWNGQLATTPPWSRSQHDSYMAVRARELREFHQNGLGRWGDGDES